MSAAPPVNRILALVLDQGADELRLGTNRAPRMYARGTQKRLTLGETNDETLRILLGDLLNAEREEALRRQLRVECEHDLGDQVFQVTFTARSSEEGFEVGFVRGRPSGTTREARGVDPSVTPPSSRRMPASAAVSVAVEQDPPPSMRAGAGGGGPLAAIVARALAMRASDVHLADREAIRVRVDGVLRSLEMPADDVKDLLGLAPDIALAVRGGRAFDFRWDVRDVGPLRIHVYATLEGLAAAVRLLPPEPPLLSALGTALPIQDLAEGAHGLVLVGGPAGAGKSTTLAALAQHALRRRSVVLVSLEDPIEYTLRAPESAIVRRRHVGVHVESFAQGLRDALREDLDVLVVGELRDAETIRLAVTAAETGHLVLASLHSRSASSAVTRLLDAYPAEQQEHARVQIADSLRAVLSQRLLPRARRSGRVLAVEILRSTPAVVGLVREGKQATLGNVMLAGRADGMITLERSLADLVLGGEVLREQAMAVANDPGALASLLDR